MTTQEQYIERLKELVSEKFGQAISSKETCEALANAIFEEVGTTCDSTILEELYGIGSHPVRTLRPATLSTLARYIGYSGWSSFCTSSEILPAIDTDIIPVRRRWGTVILTLAAIVVVIIAIVMLLRSDLLSSNEEPTTPAATTAIVDSDVQDVYESCVAAANEHCNALREYIMTDTERIVSEIESEMATLAERIEQDVIAHYEANGTTFDEARVKRNSDAIFECCTDIYNSLLAELDRTNVSEAQE
ncbi:MAG: hypothetical protein IJD53_06540 [Alistipes sp.]|nr:hypothetical protein [Alistipes sp.]